MIAQSTIEPKHAIITNKDGIILKITSSAAKLLGNSEQDLVGKPLPFPLSEQKIKEVFGREFESELIEIDDYYSIILRNPNLVNAELNKVNESSANLIGMLSHEIKNPLASIQLSASTLLRYYEQLSDEKRDKHLNSIVNKIQCISDLLEDILSVSSSNQLEYKPELINLRSLVRELVDEQAARFPRMTFDVHFNGKMDIIALDPRLMRYVLGNLLSNAAKYSPYSTNVIITIYISITQMKIIVRDFGSGISPSDFKNLYKPFYRGTHTDGVSGTGLGLAIVKQSIDAQGGTIAVESEEGKGTTVIVEIPIPVVESSR